MTTSSPADYMVGRVLRASTRGFDCGTHSRNIGPQHDFGAFVKVPIANDDGIFALGIIYKIEIKDDQLISELVLGDAITDKILRDQRENRMIPVEVKVLNVGFMWRDGLMASLPPRPPMSLSDVVPCSPEEVYHFTQDLSFFRLILGASEVPSDDLVAAVAHWAAHVAYPNEARYPFLVRVGQQIARDLSGDLRRLSHILALLDR